MDVDGSLRLDYDTAVSSFCPCSASYVWTIPGNTIASEDTLHVIELLDPPASGHKLPLSHHATEAVAPPSGQRKRRNDRLGYLTFWHRISTKCFKQSKRNSFLSHPICCAPKQTQQLQQLLAAGHRLPKLEHEQLSAPACEPADFLRKRRVKC